MNPLTVALKAQVREECGVVLSPDSEEPDVGPFPLFPRQNYWWLS